MSFPPVKVARDVCGDIIPTISPYLDCSLCGLGWPQASGEVMFNLYRGNNCGSSETGILGDYSYWLNGAYLPGRYQFQCRNPGPDAEPNPNEWIAGGEFSWGGTWRVDSILTVQTKTQVKLEGAIRWLNPATKKLEVWATFSKVMDEDNPQGITDPRRHRIFKSGKVAITPNAAAGGIGDPVTHISFVLGTRPQIVGCGTELCSMWDGNHYYTCFRAEVTDTGGIPRLSQMGKAQQPCGGRNQFGQFQPWCFCDRITLRASGLHETAVNSDPAFALEYGPVGNPPNDVEQQVQIGGGLLVKRWGDGPTRIWTQDPLGNWVEGSWTVSQEFGPTIWAVNFGTPVFRTARLFSLAFPNPGILPDDCAPDPAPPDPNPFRWWCVDGKCIQWNAMPPNATGGPFNSMFECEGSNCQPPPPKKWYCVDGACGEYESRPPGATGGPYDTQADCQASCQPPPPQSKWYCVAGACVQSESIPPGATGGPYDTQGDCQLVCQPLPSQSWWCVNGACREIFATSINSPFAYDSSGNRIIWGDGIQPPAGATGPYASQNECLGQCQPAPTLVWICLTGAGHCIETTLETAINGGYPYFGGLVACQNACFEPDPNPYAGYYCVPVTNPVVKGQDYTCIQWGGNNGPPNGAQGGKYNTLEECTQGCGGSAPAPFPFWCVQSDDIAVKQCVQAETAPPATVSGPFLSQTACFEVCTVVVDPAPEIVQIQSDPKPRATLQPGDQARFWLPCIHRGDPIPNSGFT